MSWLLQRVKSTVDNAKQAVGELAELARADRLELVAAERHGQALRLRDPPAGRAAIVVQQELLLFKVLARMAQ